MGREFDTAATASGRLHSALPYHLVLGICRHVRSGFTPIAWPMWHLCYQLHPTLNVALSMPLMGKPSLG